MKSYQQYLICVDLDETLLTTDKRITEKSAYYIQKLSKNGHLFVLSSGRPFQGLYQYACQLSLPSTPLIVSNGTAIVWMDFKNLTIQRAITFPIKKSLFCELYQETRPYLNACLASTLTSIYTLHEELLPFWIIHKNQLVSHHEGEISDMLDEDILNATFQVADHDYPSFLRITRKAKYRHLLFYCWGHYEGITTIEVSLKKATKGHALKYLKSLYHIDRKRTISFGDAPNDLSMLKSAYEGVCMINAPLSMKERVKHLTSRSNNEDGVMDYLINNHPELFMDNDDKHLE